MVYKQNATVTTVYSLLNSTGDENCDRYLSYVISIYSTGHFLAFYKNLVMTTLLLPKYLRGKIWRQKNAV